LITRDANTYYNNAIRSGWVLIFGGIVLILSGIAIALGIGLGTRVYVWTFALPLPFFGIILIVRGAVLIKQAKSQMISYA